MGLLHMSFMTAAHVLQQRESIVKLATGCKDVDNILEGEPHPLVAIVSVQPATSPI